MLKHALTAIASIALPIATVPTPMRAPEPARETSTAEQAEKLAGLLSLTTSQSFQSRIAAASVSDIHQIRFDVAQPKVAIDAPAPAAPRKKIADTASRSARRRNATQRTTTTARRSVAGGTIASWYNDRPAACWDRRGRHGFPSGLRVWTAHRTLPCGTTIRVTGSSGSMNVAVYDRGPYVRGRDLDLSAAAFRGVCGSTSKGVCRVTYRVA